MKMWVGQRKKKIKIFLGIVVVMLVVFLARPAITKAIFNESTAVHIDASSIENSTLVIGTHLIYLYSMNDELYEIASESAQDSGQDRIYYKSELADGTWFDITDAESLSAVVDNGTVVSNDTINNLLFTHHTRSDGITYDLRTNTAVSLFNISDRYDLMNLPELESLKLQYDTMNESGDDSDTAKRNRDLVTQFFATEVHTDETNEMDQRLNFLQSYYEQLASNNADASEIEAVENIMKRVDNARKELVFLTVDNALESLMDAVSNGTSTDEDIEYYELDDTLLTAIGSSQSSLSESLIEAQGNLLAEGDTILSKKEYELDQSVIYSAVSKDYASCDTNVALLLTLQNISDERIVSRTEEQTLLDELINNAEDSYSSQLAAGPSEEYMTAQTNLSSQALLRNIMKADMEEINSARSELQFLVNAKTIRQDSSEAQNELTKRISDTSKFTESISEDDYKESKEASVEAYREWLSNLLKETASADGTVTTASLYEQKESLQEERLAALDEEDLDLAKLLEAKIATIDDEIKTLEDSKANELQSLQEQLMALEKQIEENPDDKFLLSSKADLDAQIATINASLSSGSDAANIQNMKTEIMDRLGEQDTSQEAVEAMETQLDGLFGMLSSGSSLALTSLKTIYKEMVASAYLNDITAYDTMMTEIEEQIADSDVQTIQQSGMTQDMALSVLEDALGGTITVSGINGTEDTGTASGETNDDGAGSDGAGDTGTEDAGTEGTGSDNTGTDNTGSGSDGDTDNEEETTESQTTNPVVAMEGVSDDEALAAVLAVGAYADESGNMQLQAMASGLASAMNKSGDYSVFQTYKDGDELFVPADVLADFTGYRYVWNSTKKNAVLSKGRHFYSFTAFRSDVLSEEEQKEYMEVNAGFRGTVLLPASYLSSHFDCDVSAISGTDYSVLVNDKVMELYDELVLALSEKGGN